MIQLGIGLFGDEEGEDEISQERSHVLSSNEAGEVFSSVLGPSFFEDH